MKLFKDFYCPTPVLARKIGDAFLLFGTTLTVTFAGMEVDKWWIIGAAVLTALGKTISNFFSVTPNAE